MDLPAGIYSRIRSPDVVSCLWDSRNSFRKKPISYGIKTKSVLVKRNCLIRASAESGAEEKQRQEKQSGFNSQAMEVSTFNSDYKESGVQVWERMGALVRLSYGIGIYGVMALAGKGICHFTGVDSLGGLDLCPEAALDGFGYAVPPMMSLLFILDFLLIVTASSLGEELFYRAAVQGGLAHVFLSDMGMSKDTYGVAALTGIFPIFVPFAQAFAAVLTAALTGSLYYVAASPKAWYERRQLKKIYSHLLETLLALYLGFEWIQTNNILAPMITHTIYSAVVLGHGLWRIHDHRQKLRQRIREHMLKRWCCLLVHLKIKVD